MELPPISRDEIAAYNEYAREQEVGGHVPRIQLSDAQVNYLAVLAHNGDEEALELVCAYGNKLIAPHLKGVNWARYPVMGPDDLWQEGRLMLVKAVEKYDPARSRNYGAYAAQIIANHLGEWLECNAMTIPASRQARRRLRREGVVDEITSKALAAKQLPKYLSAFLTTSSRSDGKGAPTHEIVMETTEAVLGEGASQKTLEHEVEQREMTGRIVAALDALDPLHKQVVIYRHVHEMSVERASKALRIGMGTVRALEAEALGHLAVALEEYAA